MLLALFATLHYWSHIHYVIHYSSQQVLFYNTAAYRAMVLHWLFLPKCIFCIIFIELYTPFIFQPTAPIHQSFRNLIPSSTMPASPLEFGAICKCKYSLNCILQVINKASEQFWTLNIPLRNPICYFFPVWEWAIENYSSNIISKYLNCPHSSIVSVYL